MHKQINMACGKGVTARTSIQENSELAVFR